MKKRWILLPLMLLVLCTLCAVAFGCKAQKCITVVGGEGEPWFYGDWDDKGDNWFYGDWAPSPPRGDDDERFYEFGGYFADKEYTRMVMDADGNWVGEIEWDNNGTRAYLYALWIPNRCTVNFEVDGALVEDWKMEADFNSLVPELPVPEKEGYDFVGWMAYIPTTPETHEESMVSYGKEPYHKQLDDDYGFTVESYNPLNGSLRPKSTETTLHAVFKIKACTVTYDPNNGTDEKDTFTYDWGTPSETVLDGLMAPGIVMNGKMLAGWSTEPDELVPFTGPLKSDLTIYAIWLEYKTFRFVTEGGAVEELRVMKDGKQYDVPAVTRPGYEFEGWYETPSFEGQRVTKIDYDTATDTYYAKWRLLTYTITFDARGGSITPASVSYDVTQTIELPASAGTREHYTFLGWCMEEDCSDMPVSVLRPGTTGHFTMYAKWRGEDVTVTLNALDGSIAADSVTVEYGTKCEFGVPQLEGYRFGGWYTQSNTKITGEDGVSLEPWTDGPATLVAHYDKLYTLTVNFSHENAGTVTAEQTYIEGEHVTVLLNQTEDGYSFLGFYREGKLVYAGFEYAFNMPAQDVAIEARFEPRKYTVTLDYNGGVERQTTVELTFGEAFTLPVAFLRGQLFTGWFLEEEKLTDGNGSSLSVWTTKKAVTLVAHYEQDSDASGKTTIQDAEGFLAIQEDPAGNYVLGANINLSGKTWTPFAFTGTLQGNGFIVRNLSVSVTMQANAGIFTTLSGAVRNLVFENLTVTGNIREFTKNYVIGGICGELTGTIENVVIRSGKISGGSSEGFVVMSAAGFAGTMSGGTIVNCENRADVLTLPGYTVMDYDYGTGGIVGTFKGGTMDGNKNFGAVSGGGYVGGICGRVDRGSVVAYSNLTNSGAVTGTGDFVGGIFGYFKTAYTSVYDSTSIVRFTNFSNSGAVTGKNYVGGNVGYMENWAGGEWGGHPACAFVGQFLSNAGSVTGKMYVGGILGYGSANGGGSSLTATSSGHITAESRAGGIVGVIAGIPLIDCSNAGTQLTVTGLFTEGEINYAYIGGYAGQAYSVTNCHNAVPILYTQGGRYVGGIVGYSNGTLTDCSNEAEISAGGSDYVGGIAGYTTYGGSVTFTLLKNSGAISGKQYVGGLIGRVYNAFQVNDDLTLAFTIANGRNSGTVSGTQYVGGIAGDIVATASGQWGHRASCKIMLSFIENTADIAGEDFVGGIAGSADCNAVGSLRQYQQTGQVTATGENQGELFGLKSGINIEE